ncbi:MAG: GNAT family N-acetyltransferase [Bacteroidales bacterium]|nr:GNAT family N-acetyltransferase [Bacteroidales bacterium]
MKKRIETERLYLRELTPDDALYFYHLNLDAEVIRFTGDDSFKSVEEARIFLENYDQYKKYGFGRWAVIRKSDEEFLGWCGLKYSPESDEVDVGFRFFRKYWNLGYATESASASLEWGFQHLERNEIIARAMKGNTASIRVLEKTGMTYIRDFNFEGSPGVIYLIHKNTTE